MVSALAATPMAGAGDGDVVVATVPADGAQASAVTARMGSNEREMNCIIEIGMVLACAGATGLASRTRVCLQEADGANAPRHPWFPRSVVRVGLGEFTRRSPPARS